MPRQLVLLDSETYLCSSQDESALFMPIPGIEAVCVCLSIDFNRMITQILICPSKFRISINGRCPSWLKKLLVDP
jgi:hypothetical protein